MPAKKFHYKWSWRIFFGSSRRMGIYALGMSQVPIFIFPLPSRGVVGATGFEPVTSRTPSVCATRLRYAPTYNRTIRLCNIPWKLRQLSKDFPSGAPTVSPREASLQAVGNRLVPWRLWHSPRSTGLPQRPTGPALARTFRISD